VAPAADRSVLRPPAAAADATRYGRVPHGGCCCMADLVIKNYY